MQVGDKVKSRDPQTGREGAKTITAAVKRIVPAVVTVSLTDAKTGQTEALTCTPEHPFFVTGQGWVEAGSLGIGTSIVSRAGPALSVTNVTWKRDKSKELAAGSLSGGYTVYNLTVEDDHTYFVGTTDGGTWVHNGCYRDTYFDAHPNVNPDTTIVHHAIEQQVEDKLPGRFTNAEINDLSNLRGIDESNNGWMHLSSIRKAWNAFYRLNPNASRGEIQEYASYLDNIWGGNFLP